MMGVISKEPCLVSHIHLVSIHHVGMMWPSSIICFHAFLSQPQTWAVSHLNWSVLGPRSAVANDAEIRKSSKCCSQAAQFLHAPILIRHLVHWITSVTTEMRR